MAWIKFKYNSNHKIITVVIVILWAIIHFTLNRGSDNHYDNGQIKSTGSTVNSINNGQWTWYYENGNKEMQGSFVKGKREGKWTLWDKNGHKISENAYEHDKLNGLTIKLNIEGEIISKQLWEDDVLIEEILQ